MKKSSLALSLLLVLSLLMGIMPAMAENSAADIPLVVGEGAFSEKFSPFLADSVYDMNVNRITQLSMSTLDRMGNMIMNGIDGETTTYGGTEYTYYTPADLSVEYDQEANVTTYTAKIRDDLVFSDGVPVTADDIIFTYYTFLDTAYVGSTTLNSYPIIGLQNYRTQTTDDVYDKYYQMFDAVYAAGADGADGDWTAEQQASLWDTIEAVWIEDVGAIVDSVYNSYAASYAEDIVGATAEDVGADEGLKVAFGMAMWGFGEVGEDGSFTDSTGKAYTMEGNDKPTLEDFYAATYEAYEGDPVAYWDTEKADDSDVLETARGRFIGEWGPQDEGVGEGGVPNIAGIKKVDDYTVTVQTTGYEAPAIYSIFGNYIAPLHYYGDPEQYDYENNMFGFPRGNVDIMESKTRVPLGGGQYKFVSYENKTVYLEANENYFLGEAATKYVQFKETNNNEMIAGVQTGTIDLANVNGSKKDFEAVAATNDNGELVGNVISTSRVDNRGYGYIGMNADNILVGNEPFSVESKSLRKALGTVMAVYRDVSYDSYYGDAAAVINYPISNVSWAAPQPTDEDYKLAFSVDVDGNDIYTSDMDQDTRYAAALEAAVAFFKAAGFTFDEATGLFTEAPEGAKLTYELTISGDGTGDHPSFAVVTDAANALASIGITLKINDLSDSSILWDMIDAGTQELWCAAWQSNNPDPDMYQIYHSSNIVGRGGTDSNNYHVDIPELDELILQGRQSDDQAFRKSIYKQALDIIVDAAVELPAYQRQNAFIFSVERIDMDTVTPDITTWWEWREDANAVSMNAVQ